tara:strand:- start:2740 stop:3180 length:441 start_codon:yes stop_codon:yes gene_type:complete
MDRRDDHFRNGEFSWFTGEVLKVASDGSNRVKVYPHGYYDVEFNNESKADDLPWATVMMPCTTPGIKDASMNHSLEIGSWVVGFFRDGPSAQDPIIMGVITGKDVPNDASDKKKVETTVAGVKTEIDQSTGNITIGAGILGKFKIF